jgi:hypothetical protein
VVSAETHQSCGTYSPPYRCSRRTCPTFRTRHDRMACWYRTPAGASRDRNPSIAMIEGQRLGGFLSVAVGRPDCPPRPLWPCIRSGWSAWTGWYSATGGSMRMHSGVENPSRQEARAMKPSRPTARKHMQAIYDAVVALTDAFRRDHLTDEYPILRGPWPLHSHASAQALWPRGSRAPGLAASSTYWANSTSCRTRRPSLT